jgi:histidinol-phosphate aminotransferase
MTLGALYPRLAQLICWGSRMQKIDFHFLANNGIRELIPYQPGKSIEAVKSELGLETVIKLASNENPLGPSEAVKQTILQMLPKLSSYPEDSMALKMALANVLGIHPTQITLGNGSENILEMIIKAYLHPKTNAIISAYTFQTIPLLLQSYGIPTKVISTQGFAQNIHALLNAIDAQTRMIFLVNPNNPTGDYINITDFEYFIQHVPEHILVVVDEAYCEYMQVTDYPNAQKYIAAYPNLIITRTFSKIYGLAALRLGYSFSSTTIAEVLNRARLPFNVNAFAIYAAIAALKDQTHIQHCAQINYAGRLQLECGLKNLGLTYLPSYANFISIDVKDGMGVFEALQEQGVIVRPLHSYQMHRFIRVSVGTQEQNAYFLKALERVLTIIPCA